MQGIQFGQGLAIGHRVAARERPHRRTAAVAQVVEAGELADQSLHLGH